MAETATMSATVAPEGGHIIVEARGVQPKAPLFFSATAEQTIRLGAEQVSGELKLKLRVLQGRPEVLTLGLSGDGEIFEVAGSGLRDWAVRQGTGEAAGKRFLDLRPAIEDGKPAPQELEILVRTRVQKPRVPGRLGALIVIPGNAVGFSSTVALIPEPSVDLRVLDATGMLPLDPEPKPHRAQRFHSSTDGKLEVMLVRRGAVLADAELVGAQLIGKLDEAGGSADFRLRGEARVRRPDARLPLLSGRAALSETASGDGWHVELLRKGNHYAYELVFERAGVFPLDLAFAAAVREKGDWRTLDFQMPAAAVVPLLLEGLGEGVTFDPSAPVVPGATPGGFRGFLPANGNASLAWKRTRQAGEGTLFFTGSEQTDVRIRAGLLQQTSQITFRLLQGKLPAIRLRLDGPGEILGVEGSNVVGWKVVPVENEKQRVLEVRLSRPIENEGTLTVRSQAALGSFPVRAEPVRLTPEGAVRHSGFVRVANSGAVRLEVTDIEGLMQLAPAQFPGTAAEESARQIFVYRFASAAYGYRVLANPILPEVNVSLIATHELTETDRVINADLELDIREAPLREWSITIPEDYAVVSLSGNDVADYIAETEAANGGRALKILFSKPVEGRQLVRLRLEKNQPAAAGDWQLAPLLFPGAKTVRGHLGIVSAPGYRIVSAKMEKLAEVPLSFFPKQMPGLQHAYRLREPGWTAEVKIEALGQSVQTDVFHLYSLKEGVVYGSVLLNYFVVGAPASEWRIEVPEAVGNIDVVGQNVRRDWRREGNQVIVSLHQPVLGPATLLITFEQPMSARGGIISPGEVRPLGVQGERGFIQVVSPLQVQHAVRKAEGGLLKLEPLELPAEFRLLTTSPSLAVYQYTARPFALQIGIEWYAPGETVDQVVDFAKLTSQISRDGQVVTDARFFVKTRGRKALRMVLPEGVKLWEARADNEVVNARADGEQTLIPLPPRTNPNEPVEVALRLGQTGKRASRLSLSSPKMLVPTVISEWTLRGDPERLLVPKGGTAELLAPALTESGFEWLSNKGRHGVFMLLLTIGLAGALLKAASRGKQTAGLLIGGIAVLLALVLTVRALSERRVNSGALTYAATVIPAGETALLHVANVEAWRAMISWWGVAGALLGAALLAWSLLGAMRGEGNGTLGAAAGAVLFSIGLLAQLGGAVFFFAAAAAGVFFILLVPGFRRAIRTWRERESRRDPAAAPVIIALISACLYVSAPPESRAETVAPEPPLEEGAKPTEAMIQSWTIQKDRLVGEIELRVRGVVGDSFLLLKPPAVLTDFQGDGLRISKVERAGQTAYFVAPERDGLLTARAKFEMPAVEFTKGLALPTGPAAMQRITILFDQSGWEFTSPMAVRVLPTTGLREDQSGATLVLGPSGAPTIQPTPRRRDIASEATQIFAELANLYIPGPGVVNGHHRVTIRTAQGRVSELEFDVPKGLTVGDVKNGPVGEWRFDPITRKLRIAVEPAQTDAFKFDIETQLGTEALPVDVVLEPLRIAGAAGEVGMIALAFGGDAQPEGVRPAGLSPVNLDDFDADVIPKGKEKEPLAVLQQVYRYGKEGGRLELKVAPVAPEVRVTTKQVLSLGDDRLLLAIELSAAITRAGLFKLSFVLPEGLEIEALSGAALREWTEAQEEGKRVITMHLAGRTIGTHAFTLTLAGAAPAAQKEWTVPRVLLREGTRQTGEILLVPEKGIQLQAVGRESVSQLDPRAAGGTRPGTLAFRILQQDWVLKVAIEALDPWITVQALEEVTVREGQTLTRLALRYRVENASVKQLRVRLPGLNEEQARTVRATGSAVTDIVKASGAPDLWEIRFQRGIAGETDVQIEFQGQTARDQGKEPMMIPAFEGTRQTTLFVAIRGSGRLELEAGDIPRGWQRIDWSAVPANLQDRADRSVPALCFRVAEPERALAVTVRRHEVADALKLRVTSAELTSIFSPRGPFLTAAELKMQVVEKSTIRVRLPEHAQLFNTFVNGESVSVVREGDAYLFHVTLKNEQERGAAVRLVYAVPDPQKGDIELHGPSLSAPLENVSWRVIVPPGYDLADYEGGLRLKEEKSARLFGVKEYQSLISSTRASENQKATALLEEANSLLQQGEQQQAGEALNRATKAKALDEASNEDARVQLRNLKTQQAVLGLNTRRQKLYLDNRADVQRNEQLEQAAQINPFMQGKTNFDPQQVDQLLMGNTADENSALRGIAGRLVDQQLAAEPAPSAIDVTIPERGKVLTFTRSLQVDGDAPLKLELELRPVHRASVGFVLLVALALAIVAATAFPRRAENV